MVYGPRHEKTGLRGFRHCATQIGPVQSQNQARGLKFWLYVEEELYYPNNENKGADQLRSYREADPRLCFRIGKKSGFLMMRLTSS